MTHTKDRTTVVVGIAGGSAAGKTSFTNVLVENLKTGSAPLVVNHLGMDRYFYRGAPGGPRLTLPSTGEDMPDNNHPDSADNVRLAGDIDGVLASADGPDVLVVEGLMALHVDIIRSRLDLKLFVDLEADVRALRRLLRDMSGGRGNTDPQWIATYYRECARIGHARYVEPSRAHADITIRGDCEFTHVAPMIADVVRGLLARRA